MNIHASKGLWGLSVLGNGNIGLVKHNRFFFTAIKVIHVN